MLSRGKTRIEVPKYPIRTTRPEEGDMEARYKFTEAAILFIQPRVTTAGWGLVSVEEGREGVGQTVADHGEWGEPVYPGAVLEKGHEPCFCAVL